MDASDELTRAVDLFVRQVGHWTAPRWAAPAADGNVARAELAHRLVQRIANLAADAEGEPRRTVPRLANDGSLPDQLRVVTADLIAAGASADVLVGVAQDVAATRHVL